MVTTAFCWRIIAVNGVSMATAPLPENRMAARMALVERHVAFENQHDLDGVLSTFGSSAEYQDSPWGLRYDGRDGVRTFYSQLMHALPDLNIAIQQRHVSDDAIVLEVMIRGTHLGAWKGLPATGRKVELPLCGVYTFDANDRLAGEKIYYDRGTVLRQLGVFHEPNSIIGRATTALTHPVSMLRALLRGIFAK
ncbi:MAG TPA: ester cyclase [Terriglobales bacterium]|nr:ester cyclase [Terriglobales bacterium]